MEQTKVKPVYSFFEDIAVGAKVYTEDYVELNLRNESTRWNKYTERRYRVMRDENKKLFVYRES